MQPSHNLGLVENPPQQPPAGQTTGSHDQNAHVTGMWPSSTASQAQEDHPAELLHASAGTSSLQLSGCKFKSTSHHGIPQQASLEALETTTEDMDFAYSEGGVRQPEHAPGDALAEGTDGAVTSPPGISAAPDHGLEQAACQVHADSAVGLSAIPPELEYSRGQAHKNVDPVHPDWVGPGSEERLKGLLQSVMGFGEFRGRQLEVVRRVLAGRSTLAVLPTGEQWYTWRNFINEGTHDFEHECRQYRGTVEPQAPVLAAHQIVASFCGQWSCLQVICTWILVDFFGSYPAHHPMKANLAFQ